MFVNISGLIGFYWIGCVICVWRKYGFVFFSIFGYDFLIEIIMYMDVVINLGLSFFLY